jgi:site-specific recombinase XerD
MGSGLRRAELCGLRVEDLCLKGVEPYLVVTRGKGGKVREVPIGPGLAKVLRGYLRELAEREGVDKVEAGPLFRSERGGRLDPSAVWRVVNKLQELAGCKRKGVGVHCTRHTYAQGLACSGVDVLTISDLLGHSDIRTTQVYVSAPWADKVEAVKGL